MTGSGNDQLGNERVNFGLLAAHLKQLPADTGARSAVVRDQDAHHVAYQDLVGTTFIGAVL
jgi:hypothetical protein